MARYYLIATLIVVAIGSALVAHRLATTAPKPPARPAAPPPPHSGPNNGFVTTPPPFFDGEGGWVMSALPECFDQRSAIEGPAAALTFHIPPARTRIRPGTTVRAANCTVMVREHDIWVARGKDRLRVPPEARLYAFKDALTLVFERPGRIEVRTYVVKGR